MNGYVVENWFDYEIGGKVPLSLLESQFNEEMSNFEKMLNVIDVCNESGIVLEVDTSKMKEKLKELVKKAIALMESIRKFISEKIDEFINRLFRKKAKLKSENNKKEDNDKVSDEDKISDENELKEFKVAVIYIDYTNGRREFNQATKILEAIKNILQIEKLRTISDIFEKRDEYNKAIELLNSISFEKDFIEIEVKNSEVDRLIDSSIRDLKKTKSEIDEEISYSRREIKDLEDTVNETSSKIMPSFWSVIIRFNTEYIEKLKTIVPLILSFYKDFAVQKEEK